jgi:hypothetical protein
LGLTVVVVVTGAVVVVVMEAPVVDVDDVDDGALELVQAASIRATTTITAMPSLRTVLIVSPIVLPRPPPQMRSTSQLTPTPTSVLSHCV